MKCIPNIGNGSVDYTWFHCDTKFKTYIALNYLYDNWQKLIDLVSNNHQVNCIDLNFIFDQITKVALFWIKLFKPAVRANLIHNLFLNAYAERSQYGLVTQMLGYLKNELDYLPWKTLEIHLENVISVLEYRRSFKSISVIQLS